jgi:ketosteroid isomerase-like protein
MRWSDRRGFLASTAVVTAWCVGGRVEAQAADTANVALVKSLYAAFGRGDTAALVAAMAPEVDWQVTGRVSDAPTFGARKGPAGVEEFFKLVGSSYTFSEFAPKEFYPIGDKVFVLGHYTMTVKKTGKSMASDWAHIFTISGAKVTAFREFLDTARAAEAFRA